MNESPKISVIIPIYNVEAYLHKCVNSVINQSYKNLEIILVNDGSPDNSAKICDEYARLDSRVKVIHQHNLGLSGARNTGLKICSGDYVAFVDSDDWIELEMFDTMLNLALKYNLKIVECGIIEKTSENFVSTPKPIMEASFVVEEILDSYKRIITDTSFSVWRRLYKKEIVENSFFQVGKISEDVYFTIDNLKKTSRLGFISYPFYNYRINPKSITRGPYTTKDFDALEAALYLENRIELDFKEEQELQIIAKNHLLKRLLRHYKLLNYNKHVDPKFIERNKTKEMINNYYSSDTSNSFSLYLAKTLSIRSFEILMAFHTVKLKVDNKFNKLFNKA